MNNILNSIFPKSKKHLEIIIIFFLLIIFFLVLFFVSRKEINDLNENKLNIQFSIESGQIIQNIEEKYKKYFTLLRSARGLFYSSDSVTREEWNMFVNSLDIQKNYPSLVAFAYVSRVSENEKEKFIQSVRSDNSIVPNGYPEFNITPLSDNKDHYVVNYLEPLVGNEAAFGFDLFTETVRKNAIELSRDTNSLIISDPVNLVTSGDNQKSILLFIPLYKDFENTNTLFERRENVQGFILGVLKGSDLFSRIITSTPIIDLKGFSVIDVTGESKILTPFVNVEGKIDEIQGQNIPEVQKNRLNIGSRIWEIIFKSDKEIQLTIFEKLAPHLLMIFGVSISVLIYLVLYSNLKLREKAENLAKELTKDLQKFKLAVDYSSDHIVITDNQGIVLYANDAVEKITGFPIKEVLGKKAGSKELWGGLMDPKVYKKLWNQISVNKKPFRGEFNNKRKDGRNYVAEAYVSPITNDKNEVIFFVGIERDITKAKEIDKLKNEFVSLTSHELRTPMTAIKGFASMILEGDYGKVPEKIISPLKDIFSSTERLILLVNDMLNLSRIEAGRLKFNLKEFDPSEVTNSVVNSLKPIAKDKGLILEVEKEQKGIILGDEDKISQVLNNLIGNSLKFTTKGFVKVETTIRKDHFIFLVKDSGIGIAKEDMDKVFGKFEQISSAQMGKPQGTGLGLYISKQIANKLGGDVWIEESTPQKGSVFGFSLPLAESSIAKKVKIDIAKEASVNPDQKEMS